MELEAFNSSNPIFFTPIKNIECPIKNDKNLLEKPNEYNNLTGRTHRKTVNLLEKPDEELTGRTQRKPTNELIWNIYK
ncbi:22282_t:CDS:2, partial [Dentiscutata erythropus]